MNYQNNRQKILMLRGLNIQCDMLSTTYYWIMLDFQCEGKICESCQEVIADRYFLHVNGGCWHADCLRCCVCYSSLEQEDSCFVKEDNIYCKQDYIRYLSLSLSHGQTTKLLQLATSINTRFWNFVGHTNHCRNVIYNQVFNFALLSEFGSKCSKCCRRIQATDWVRRARDHVYHLACFACDACQRQLSTGEEFALSGGQVLCLRHYKALVEGDTDKGKSILFSPIPQK